MTQSTEHPRSFQYCVFFCGLPVPLFEGVFFVGGLGPEHTYFVADECGAPIRSYSTQDLAEMLSRGKAFPMERGRPTLTVSERRIPGVPS